MLRALIKREVLTNREVLHWSLVHVNSFCFVKLGFHMIVWIIPVVAKKGSDDREDHMETLPRR